MTALRTDDFDFDLPPGAIALRPAVPRDSARLLVVDPATLRPQDRHVYSLPEILKPGDLLVFNDTKVLPAQLYGCRVGRGGTEPAIGVTLVERLSDGSWRGFAKPARRLTPGDVLRFGVNPTAQHDLQVTEKLEDGLVTLQARPGSAPVETVMLTHGLPPLPPYIASKRPADIKDVADYQTLYACHEGAVAAPTAGLHFTHELFRRLDAAGVGRIFLTLHTGAGTFLPVKQETLDAHKLHAEWGQISEQAAAAINRTKAERGRIIAVGTTVLRLLESVATGDGEVQPFEGATDLFIKPGFKPRAADMLLTNFHLPKSTLFVLTCAFSGTRVMKSAYAHAIANGYRFYSYGDACLLAKA